MGNRDLEKSLELLLQKNRDLQNKLNEANAAVDSLKAENAELKAKQDEYADTVRSLENLINSSRMEKKNAERKNAAPAEAAEQSADIPECADIDLDPGLNDAAAYIGRAVQLSADLCGNANDFPAEDRRDIINLALGRTEVFKSDVVTVMRSGLPDDRKKSELDGMLKEFEGYIDGLKLQK